MQPDEEAGSETFTKGADAPLSLKNKASNELDKMICFIKVHVAKSASTGSFVQNDALLKTFNKIFGGKLPSKYPNISKAMKQVHESYDAVAIKSSAIPHLRETDSLPKQYLVKVGGVTKHYGRTNIDTTQ